MTPIRLLLPCHRMSLRNHLLSLSNEDRRLRFGICMSDQGITEYVSSSYYKEDSEWFAIVKPSAFGASSDEVLAAVHSSTHEDTCELGLSVSEGYRGLGYGDALFKRAVSHSKAVGANHIYMQCLSENKAIQHIARKNGMTIGTIERNEKEATISIQRNPLDGYLSACEEAMGIYDYSLKKFNPENIFGNLLTNS